MKVGFGAQKRAANPLTKQWSVDLRPVRKYGKTQCAFAKYDNLKATSCPRTPRMQPERTTNRRCTTRPLTRKRYNMVVQQDTGRHQCTQDSARKNETTQSTCQRCRTYARSHFSTHCVIVLRTCCSYETLPENMRTWCLAAQMDVVCAFSVIFRSSKHLGLLIGKNVCNCRTMHGWVPEHFTCLTLRQLDSIKFTMNV